MKIIDNMELLESFGWYVLKVPVVEWYTLAYVSMPMERVN